MSKHQTDAQKCTEMLEKCTRAFSLRPCSTQRLPWRLHRAMNNAAHIEAFRRDAAVGANLTELGF
jgi:hypothetical protein